MHRCIRLVLSLVLACSAVFVASALPARSATGLEGYDPGNLISDASFFAPLTMNSASIAAFLAEKGASCVRAPDGTPCLKDYRAATPTMAQTAYCGLLNSVAMDSAAGMIERVAAACRINPQVLIVLIQRESGLITASGTRLSALTYSKATGAGCPDFQPCDPALATFFLQVYAAGERFQKYRALPGNYAIKAGQTNQILYNPDSRCGRASVHVANQATAGLYNYTPYTADAASLAAVSAEGGYCSAYGNRNFFRIMKTWFPAAMNTSGAPPIVPTPGSTMPGRIVYAGHVADIGWQRAVVDGQVAGTTGQARRLEALRLWGDPATGGIVARGHVQDIGWQPWVTSGGVLGTTDRRLPLEAVEFKLTGLLAERYDIRYRAHVATIGWQPHRTNGATAGTVGAALPIEAVEIELVPKAKPVGTSYAAHVAELGWLPSVTNGQTAGTTGRALRLEALTLRLTEATPDAVAWTGHVQDIGWMGWTSAATPLGTTGRGLRLEAFQMRLTGTWASTHTLRYRAHVQDIGWQPWVADGATAGTVQQARQVEAVEIVIAPRQG